MEKIKPIAIYLPQFHPIPENDIWWGKGFTEWTNVTKAKPLFKGHYQPHIPMDIGYYDLRLEAARLAQEQMAKDYGIYGFCYYHYWFNGKRLLHEPLERKLKNPKEDLPFMLCWANENWTRAWDGKENEILIKQEYNNEDDVNHIRWLCAHVFLEERYIKVNGCPVFLVYRHNLLPNIKRTVQLWRDIAINEFGFKGLYLCFTESFGDRTNPLDIGFDAAVEFSAHSIIKNKLKYDRKTIWLQKLGLKRKIENVDVRDYEKGVEESINRRISNYKLYRSVTPSWDNTARKRENGIVAQGSSPALYYKWLKYIVKSFIPYSKEENFVFINAWNEWAEGNHLEPCEKYKYAYLEATKRALKSL
ncbi:glycoside hydrolase family 99-like domain-containing protein [Flavobacterium flavipallidum]|uniref:Glycoside hydrolase family 99-like domain-containing protein n=1 Tax=Flavobacterium flavipallidum TaxID=3139140 RepID=A0ABU9HJ43_9FLAO